MRRNAVLGTVAAALGLLAAGQRAQAQGFGVYEHDACTMARAGTGVASPCGNGSAIFFNPAGIVGSANRWNFSFGGTLITLNFHHLDSISGLPTDAVKNNIPIPAFYVTRQINNRWAAGFGMYVPYGLIVEWPTTFAGRFLSYRSDLKAIYFQPTVAFRAHDKLRIGGGLTYARSTVDLRQRVDLSSQLAAPGLTFAGLGIPAGTDFADAHLHGSSWSGGGHVGAIWEPHRKISIGARYLFSMHADIQGDAEFTQIGTGYVLAAGNPLGAPGGTPLDSVLAPQFRTGTLAPQHAAALIPLPDQVVVGVAVRPTADLTVLADWQFVHWKKFNELPLSFEKLGRRTLYEDYRNTNGWRFGAEYRMQGVTLRGGWLRHEAAAPAQTVTPLLPEGARTEFTAGVGFNIGSRAHLDAAFQHIKQQDRRGRTIDPPTRGPAGVIVNTGLYSGTANLFGASISLVR